jgi:hypothetical protein
MPPLGTEHAKTRFVTVSATRAARKQAKRTEAETAAKPASPDFDPEAIAKIRSGIDGSLFKGPTDALWTGLTLLKVLLHLYC